MAWLFYEIRFIFRLKLGGARVVPFNEKRPKPFAVFLYTGQTRASYLLSGCFSLCIWWRKLNPFLKEVQVHVFHFTDIHTSWETLRPCLNSRDGKFQREKSSKTKHNSESDDQKIRDWQLRSLLRKRKLLLNAIHKMYIFCRVFFGGWGGYLFLAVSHSRWDLGS